MKIPHFFKAKSRLGLPNIPIHQIELTIGVEEGPDAILSEAFLKSFKKYKNNTYQFPDPEDIDPEVFELAIAKSIDEFRNQIVNSLMPDEIQVVIGGDHSITLPSELAVIKRISDVNHLGHIHFDSHGDINLKKDSPTNNFHGMYLRPLFDRFDIPEIEATSKLKIPAKNILYMGNLDLDTGEESFLIKNNIRNINKNEIISKKVDTLSFFSKIY